MVEDHSKLHRQQQRMQRLVYLLLAWLSCLTFVAFYDEWRHKESHMHPAYDPHAPHAAEIKAILENIRYNGLYALLEPDAAIDMDFKNGTWTIRNIHNFDASGNVVLEHGRFGSCGDLAAYTYQKIRPLFADHYKITFLTVAESSFFKAENGTHVILRIRNTRPFSQTDMYLDPSFRKYGPAESFFDNYLILSESDHLEFVKEKRVDETYQLDGGPPILINRNVLFSVFLMNSNGKFDKDNFTLGLVKCKRYQYTNRYIFAIRKTQGKTELMEAGHDARALVTPGVYDLLRARLIELFEDAEKRLTPVTPS